MIIHQTNGLHISIHNRIKNKQKSFLKLYSEINEKLNMKTKVIAYNKKLYFYLDKIHSVIVHSKIDGVTHTDTKKHIQNNPYRYAVLVKTPEEYRFLYKIIQQRFTWVSESEINETIEHEMDHYNQAVIELQKAGQTNMTKDVRLGISVALDRTNLIRLQPFCMILGSVNLSQNAFKNIASAPKDLSPQDINDIERIQHTEINRANRGYSAYK